ncbi:MAG: universal stress protein [Steroidobacteraceae bacterium]
MPSPKKILVAVKDPFDRKLPALRKALALARAAGGQVQLFHSLSAPIYLDALTARGDSLRTLESRELKRSRAALEKLASRPGSSGVRISVAAEWDYPPAEAIVRQARKWGASLIIADRHAGARHARWLLSFNDWELLRLAPCPVLIAKTEGGYDGKVVVAAVDPTHAHAKPAALDTAILNTASDYAEMLRAKLHAVTACPAPPVYPSFGYMEAYALPDSSPEERLRSTRAELDKLIGKRPIARDRRHVISAEPSAAIVTIARKQRAGLVVMGAVSRSAIKRLFIGNTAERTLDALPCDALVVKPRSFRSPVARGSRGLRIMATPAVT